MVWILSLLGCSQVGPVVWKSLATDEVADDVALTLFTFGLAEDDDREVVDALHASGTFVRMELSGWGWTNLDTLRAESMNDDVCHVEANHADSTDTVLTLSFSRAGSTDLFITDDDGMVVDWQPIEVRDPVAAALYPYEGVAVGDLTPADRLDVIPYSAATVALTWQSALGEALAGTGLLSVAGDGDGVRFVLSDALAGNAFEAFDIVVEPDAPLGTSTAVLRAGDADVRTVDVTVHDPAEITSVTLSSAIRVIEAGTPGDTGGEAEYSAAGTVRALVAAGTTPLVGVPVTWTQDGAVMGEGPWVRVESDDPTETHELQACWDSICGVETIPGSVVEVGSSVASQDLCACAPAGPGAWTPGAGLVAALVVLRRRRRPGATAD